MKNKFLLGIVAISAASCFGSPKSTELLKEADKKWESFKLISAPVLNADENDIKTLINTLDSMEYTDNNLDDISNDFVKAFKNAESQINALKSGLYNDMNTAWTAYTTAVNAYINSLMGSGNKSAK